MVRVCEYEGGGDSTVPTPRRATYSTTHRFNEELERVGIARTQLVRDAKSVDEDSEPPLNQL